MNDPVVGNRDIVTLLEACCSIDDMNPVYFFENFPLAALGHTAVAWVPNVPIAERVKAILDFATYRGKCDTSPLTGSVLYACH